MNMSTIKKILVPISFSPSSKNALETANGIAEQTGATLSLLHCFPTQTYSRKYDFGKKDYEQGIKEMLEKFYTQTITPDHQRAPLMLTYAGAVSEAVTKLSPQYDLFVISRKVGHLSKSNRWFGDKLFYISSKSLCPVLIASSKHHDFLFSECKNIWHLKRRDTETDLVNRKLIKFGIDQKRVSVKSAQQNTFISALWRNIVTYSKNHDNALLGEISKSFDDEHIDLIILVNHRKGMFEQFLKEDAFQIVSQLDVPILVF